MFSYLTALNTLELCERKISDVEIVYHSFETSGFCGAALAGDKENTIVLNSARTQNKRIFDCGHELIHLVRHRHLNNGIFNCSNKKHLVPYQDFIPRFISLLNDKATDIQGVLAEHYHVTPQVINIRMDSLAYEIDQYRKGTQLDCLELLSRKQRRQRGITPTC